MQSGSIHNSRIAIIGLGYVGLSLALEFGKKYNVVGFDINELRISELRKGDDRTKEVDVVSFNEVHINRIDVKASSGLFFTTKIEDLVGCNIFIITVPTPIDKFKTPDLRPLLEASNLVASILKAGDLVIYESTVYPGCTEEDCVPVLEKVSGLEFNKDFHVGYSPERVNPGDKINTLTKIKKVTSGSTPEIANLVDDLYSSIILAGTHKAPNIKVAEASKAIENAQRDINISFMNELSLIFDRMGISTSDVLAAAETKFNFLKFKPGLVGGHCIAVDPYYLAHKASELGYYPEIILSGRRVNNYMPLFIVNKVVKLMIQKGQVIKNARALILGFAFKENCRHFSNTKVIDVYTSLKEFQIDVDIFDPLVDRSEVKNYYGIEMLSELKFDRSYDVIVLAVAHDEFIRLNYELLGNKNKVLYDVKGVLNCETDGKL